MNTHATYSMVNARDNFSEMIEKAQHSKERIVVTRNRKQCVAIIPIEDLELLEDIEDKIDIKEAEKILADIDSGKEKTVPWKEFKVEMKLKK